MGQNGPGQTQPVFHLGAGFADIGAKDYLYHALIGLTRKKVGEKGNKQSKGCDDQEYPQDKLKALIPK